MRKLGFEIESMALSFLEKNGFSLLVRNFHCRRGEIDLIGLLEASLIFVEVRYRKNINFGYPQESVTVRKQRKIKHAAAYFLKCHPFYTKFSCRFDVIAVTLRKQEFELDWIPNAF